MAKTKFSIEGAFEQLEDIIEQLSSEEISLSDSMDLYKKGVKILDKCSHTGCWGQGRKPVYISCKLLLSALILIPHCLLQSAF